jgi:hypothetical protein
VYILSSQRSDPNIKTMPPLLTQVARLSDGLPLVAIQTPAHGIPITSQDQQEAKGLLQKITAG